MNQYRLEEGRYALMESETEHSSENQVPINLLDVEEIAERIKGDPIKKTIYFAIKIEGGTDNWHNCSVQFIKVKGFEKQLPMVNCLAVRDKAILCSVETISTIKVFKFVIEFETKEGKVKKIESRDISFSCNNFLLLEFNFGYSLSKQKVINSNILEDLIIMMFLAPETERESIKKLTIRHSPKIID